MEDERFAFSPPQTSDVRQTLEVFREADGNLYVTVLSSNAAQILQRTYLPISVEGLHLLSVLFEDAYAAFKENGGAQPSDSISIDSD